MLARTDYIICNYKSISKCCSLLFKGYWLFENERDLIMNGKPLTVFDSMKEFGVMAFSHNVVIS